MGPVSSRRHFPPPCCCHLRRYLAEAPPLPKSASGTTKLLQQPYSALLSQRCQNAAQAVQASLGKYAPHFACSICSSSCSILRCCASALCLRESQVATPVSLHCRGLGSRVVMHRPAAAVMCNTPTSNSSRNAFPLLSPLLLPLEDAQLHPGCCHQYL